MIPIFSSAILPGSIRTAIAISLLLFIYPAFSEGVDLQAFTALQIAMLGLKEVVIGVLMGFGIAVLLWAVESAGYLIDNQRGSTMASSVDPLTGSQTSPLGIFLTQVVAVFFMVGGGFFVMMAGIYESYVLFPVFEFFPKLSIEAASHFLTILDRIVALAVLLAAPAMIAMFLSEFGLGLVSRFAPQLNVFFLSMGIKSAVGILILILYVGLMGEIWENEIATIPSGISVLGGLLR